MNAPIVLVFVLVVLGILIGGPILALVAFVRMRQLEGRLAGLEARIAAARASGPVEGVATGPPDVAAVAARTGEATRTDAGVAVAPAPTPVPVPAAAPAPAPAALDWEGLIAGRWLNRIGLLAVAIGVSYFLKHAIDNEWIGPRGQVAAGLLAGAALVAWSSAFVRRGLGYFADGLAGLGAAVLYLSLWAAASYYQLLAPGVAFGAMIAVTAGMLAIALGRNAQRLAVLAMVGGFLTPWLVSTGRDAQVVLFLYLALHNVALLVLARSRDWRFLELPAFAFTQIHFWIWHGRFYTDAVLVRTTMFAALFFAQFSVLPVVRVRRSGVLRPEQGWLVLANAGLFLLVLHALFWPDLRWTLTLAVLVLSAFYLALARTVPTDVAAGSQVRVLFAGLALTCATLAIPIRLDGHWITLAWSIEAAVLAWSGFAVRLWHLRAAAYVVFLAVGLHFLVAPPGAAEFLWNARLATALVVAASAAAAAWRAGRSRADLAGLEPAIAGVLAVGANVLVLWALTREIDLYFAIGTGGTAARDVLLARSLSISLFWTLYATALVLAGSRLRRAALRWQGLALFGMATLKVFLADLGYLSGFYRIVSSIALGVVLLIVSLLYQRAPPARRSVEEASS